MIINKQLHLRPIKTTDAKGYLDCHNDDEAKLNFSSVPTTIDEAKKEILEDKNNNNKFAIIYKDKFVGFINLELNNHPLYKHQASIGYGINKNFRGKGIATLVVKKITNYGFNELKLKRISGMCRSYNKASQKVLEKANYQNEGILRKNKFINGKYVDDLIYAKIK